MKTKSIMANIVLLFTNQIADILYVSNKVNYHMKIIVALGKVIKF